MWFSLLVARFFSLQWQPGNRLEFVVKENGCVLGPLKDIDSVLKTETLHNILPCSTIVVSYKGNFYLPRDEFIQTVFPEEGYL